MEKTNDCNQILLRGRVEVTPRLSHESHGQAFYSFPLAVSRLSGHEDVLNVQVAEGDLAQCSLHLNDQIEVEGEVRTFNNRNQTGSRLIISVFAHTLKQTQEPATNLLTLCGTLCRPTVVRRTPLGREICDFMLAVNRRYGRSDYLPCIAWGTVAHTCGALTVGERVSLTGRLQSRQYMKQLDGSAQPRIAYEVSAMTVE